MYFVSDQSSCKWFLPLMSSLLILVTPLQTPDVKPQALMTQLEVFRSELQLRWKSSDIQCT